MTRSGPCRLAANNSTPPVSGHVGFDGLPDQLVNKCVKRGFEFNIIAIGETACGKSTLLDSLFKTNFDRESPTHGLSTTEVNNKFYDIEEKNVRLRLGLAQSAGFGDTINRSSCTENVVKYIEGCFEDYLQEEIHINRSLASRPDTRCHVCLYFISPSGLRSIDLYMLKAIAELVNIVPVIAKSDSLARDALASLKQQVRREIEEYGIEVYDFSVNSECANLLSGEPFSVVASDDIVEGKRVRQYPWGTVEIENEDHCDFVKLREAMLRMNMTDLVNITHNVHYSAYRSRRLREMGFLETTEGDKEASLEDTYRAKKIQQASEQKRRELELRNEFSQKVAAKQSELEESRNRMKELHDSQLTPLKKEYQQITEQQEKISESLKDVRYQVAQAAQLKTKRGAKKHSAFFGNDG